MAKLARDKQLVRAAKGRAAIIEFLNNHKDTGPVTQDVIISGGGALDYTAQDLGNMLWRMSENGLILKHKLAPNPSGYTVGYTALDAPPVAVTDEPLKRSYTRKAKTESATTVPIDVRVNERTGSITISYAGMVISFSREAT